MTERSTSTGDCTDASVSESQRALTVELDSEFDAEDVCPIVVDCDASTPVEHHVIDDACYVSCPSSEDGTAVRHRQVHVDSECVCRIVASHSCCPSIQSATGNGLVVRTNPADRATLREMIAQLREVADVVRIRSLIVDDGEPASQSELVNLQGLTDTGEWIAYAVRHSRPVLEVGGDFGLPIHLCPHWQLMRAADGAVRTWFEA